MKKNKKVLFCEKCNFEIYEGMEHCQDCQVCVYDMDHHCVFFSKCIGGGNAKPFYGTIAFLVLNFVIIGLMAAEVV